MLLARTVVQVGDCFTYAMKIVPPQDERNGASWATEAEPVARGVRRVSRCSSPVCGRFSVCSVWKIHSRHDFLRQ